MIQNNITFSKNKNVGFSLIELLIVISIIGIIATISLSSLSKARQKTNITKTQIQLKNIEKAFFLAGIEENRELYWTINELGGNGNLKSISSILDIENGPGSTISNYLNQKDTLLFNGGELYYYSTNNTTLTSSECSHLVYGVGISFRYNEIDQDLREKINDYVDGTENDRKCGQFVNRNLYSHDVYILNKNSYKFNF